METLFIFIVLVFFFWRIAKDPEGYCAKYLGYVIISLIIAGLAYIIGVAINGPSFHF